MSDDLTTAPVESGGRVASRLRANVVSVVLLGVAGGAFRLWFIVSPLGLPDADEAIVGLMAREALHGGFQAFFWGQEYGGSQEPLLVALLLGLGFPIRWALEAVPVGLHAGTALLVWRLGLRTIDRAGGAALAAATCWALSAPAIWWSTKERGFYGVTLVCGLAGLLALVRLARPSPDDRVPPPTDAALAGLAFGLGWWASPQILHFAVPGMAWFAWSMRRRGSELARVVPTAAAATLLGALPWIWANVATGLASLHSDGPRAHYGDPFTVFFRYGLPMILGLKAPITLAWVFPGAWPLYAVALGSILVLLLLRPRSLRPVLGCVAAYPVVFALLPTGFYYGEPRYLFYLWPLLALALGWTLAQLPSAARVVAVLALVGLTVGGVSRMTRVSGPPGLPFEDVSPRPISGLVATLDRVGSDRVFADYWVASRLTLETDGRIVASAIDFQRDRSAARTVREAQHPIFVDAARCHGRVAAALEEQGATFESYDVGGVWDVVVPHGRFRPEDLGLQPC